MINVSREGFAALCRQARARSSEEEDLLTELLVPLCSELGFDDPCDGIIPPGYTTIEALWNNVRNLFDHSFHKFPYFDLILTINAELFLEPNIND